MSGGSAVRARTSVGMASAIRVRALVKRFDDVVAVDGIDLDVVEGECFGR